MAKNEFYRPPVQKDQIWVERGYRRRRARVIDVLTGRFTTKQARLYIEFASNDNLASGRKEAKFKQTTLVTEATLRKEWWCIEDPHKEKSS